MKPLIILLSLFHVALYSQSIELSVIGKGFIKPVDISSTPISGDKRIFITEKDGRIRILHPDGKINSEAFLDVKLKVNSTANERGLLGLVFHPEYKTNGYFFIHYTNISGHSTVARYKVKGDNPDIAEPSSEKIIIIVPQPFNNHNAGDLAFGPDGMLYIGMGDGGSGGDPGNRAQNPKSLLGKMLRLNINTDTTAYLIPNDNPYKNNKDTLPEIWALGLRNPWRYSIDDVKKELWIADVGQDEWEEINVVPYNAPKLNYGWRCFEGLANFNINGCNLNIPYTKPVYVYRNVFEIGCSVTGGFVYRGTENKSLEGKYIYTDFCTGKIWALYRSPNNTWINDLLMDGNDMEYVSFGEDHNKELYLASLASGEIHKIKQKTSSSSEWMSFKSLKISENPITDQIRITWDPEVNFSNWSIIDINGMEILSDSHKSDINGLEINTNRLLPGMYSFRVNAANIRPLRFIKM